MDIKQLKYFSQICKNANFSKTAKELYITEQGLSKSIKNLENEFGIPLFCKNGNKIVLTKYGVYLKEKSAQIIEEFDSLKCSIEKMSNVNEKTVRIGYSLGVITVFSGNFASYFNKSYLDFKKSYPDIELNITEYGDFFCEKAVFNEEVDFGISIGPIDKSKFNYKIIALKRMCAIVSDKSDLSRNKEIDFKDIVNKKIIMLNKEFKIHHNFINRCSENGFKPNIFFTTANFSFMGYLNSISDSVGIGVHFNDIPKLNFIPFRDPACTWEVCLFTKKGYCMSEVAKFFINYILNSYCVSQLLVVT